MPLVAFAAKPTITTELEIVRSPNIKVYAFEKVLDRWGDKQWIHFSNLIDKEGSNWDSKAKNPNSTAYGIGQFLDSTWKTVDCIKTDDKYKQIDCTIDYIEARYDTPVGAIKFHNKNNWY